MNGVKLLGVADDAEADDTSGGGDQAHRTTPVVGWHFPWPNPLLTVWMAEVAGFLEQLLTTGDILLDAVAIPVQDAEFVAAY